jgi:hypothetical protein
LVFALFHQDSLGGNTCRPLDVPAFVKAHVEAFLRAYPPTVRKRAASGGVRARR